MVKKLPAVQETWLRSLGQEDALEEEMEPTPVFLHGESHGQRSLAGYSPQSHKELGTTECARVRSRARTHTHTHTHSSFLLPSDIFYFIFKKVLEGTN